MVELVRRISRHIGLARLTGLIFILCLYGKQAGFQPVILCKIIKESENQSGLGLKSYINMGNSSLLEMGLRFFKQAPHLIGLACLQINYKFLQKYIAFL